MVNERLMSVVGVAVLLAVPAIAGASPDVTLEVWGGERGQRYGEVERLTISKEFKGTGADGRVVWHARRDFVTDGATSLINSDQCPQFRALLARFPPVPVEGPDLVLEYTGSRDIPPVRKDGYDYRMRWTTYGNTEVSVRNLPHSLYQWADEIRSGLTSCWEAGRVAPGVGTESD